MLTAQPEPFAPFLEEVKPLLPLHYEELALNRDKVPLSTQYDEYLRRDALGMVITIALRNDGKLVGYWIGFKAPGLHYSTCLTLHMDIFFVHPDYRDGSAGVKLFKAMEKEAKRQGVQRLFVGSKVHKDASRLFEALKYTKVETTYSAWLGDE